jgi:hypothetical protein
MSRKEPPLGRIAVAAFGGWSDAASAATEAVSILADSVLAEPIASIGPEDFVDFQVNRPRCIINAKGVQEVVWPDTDFLMGTTPTGVEVVIVAGVEPSMRWRVYCKEVIDVLQPLGIDALVTLGSLLADVPHTRPIPVTATSQDRSFRREFDLTKPTYEGPTGVSFIVERGVANFLQIPTASLWAAVPHYVGSHPSPKVVNALLDRLEPFIGQSLVTEKMRQDAKEWEETIDAMTSEDEDMAEYVATLEAAKDVMDSPSASGEALAREFQRYLRQRHDS